MLTRFDAGPFPRDRRVFICPEPVPELVVVAPPPPAPPPVLETRPCLTARVQRTRETDQTLLEFLRAQPSWVSFEAIQAILPELSPRQVQQALRRGWETGAIERDCPPQKRLFRGPMVRRQYRIRELT